MGFDVSRSLCVFVFLSHYVFESLCSFVTLCVCVCRCSCKCSFGHCASFLVTLEQSLHHTPSHLAHIQHQHIESVEMHVRRANLNGVSLRMQSHIISLYNDVIKTVLSQVRRAVVVHAAMHLQRIATHCNSKAMRCKCEEPMRVSLRAKSRTVCLIRICTLYKSV